MRDYTREECAAILAKGRETVARLADLEVEHRNVVFLEDDLSKWRRAHAEQEERFERENRERKVSEIEQRLRNSLTTTLQAQLDEQRQYVFDVLTEVIAGISDEIQTAVGELRAEINVLRQVDKSENVETLPNPLLKRA